MSTLIAGAAACLAAWLLYLVAWSLWIGHVDSRVRRREGAR